MSKKEVENKSIRPKISDCRQTEKSLGSYAFRLTDIQYKCRDNYEAAKQELLDQFRRLRETVLEREAELLVQLQNKKLEDMGRLDRRQNSLRELTSGSGVNAMNKNELVEFQKKSKDFLLGRKTDESLLKKKCYHPTDIDDLIYRIRMFGNVMVPKESIVNGDQTASTKTVKSEETNGIEVIRRKNVSDHQTARLPSVELQRQTTNMLMSSISDMIIEPMVDEMIAERDSSKTSEDTINTLDVNDLINEKINERVQSVKESTAPSSKETESINQIVNGLNRKKFNYNYRYNKRPNWKNNRDNNSTYNNNNNNSYTNSNSHFYNRNNNMNNKGNKNRQNDSSNTNNSINNQNGEQEGGVEKEHQDNNINDNKNNNIEKNVDKDVGKKNVVNPNKAEFHFTM